MAPECCVTMSEKPASAAAPSAAPALAAGPAAANVSLDAAVAKAREAQAARQLETALIAWTRIRADHPDSPAGYLGHAAVLGQLGKPGEASKVLHEAMTRFPGNEKILIEHAWLAHAAGDWPEANRRWTNVRSKYPAAFAGYFGGGAALRSLRRFDEADALYLEAMKTWPKAANLLADYATVASARGDMEEAARRWAALRTICAQDPTGYLREAREFRTAGRIEEAEALLRQAIQRFIDNPKPAIEYALMAQQRGLTAQALKRWEAVVSAFPGVPDGYIGATHALNDLGRHADAQAVLQPALRRFPDSTEIANLNAWISHYRGDYAGAVALWAQVRERFPANPVGYIGGVTSSLAQGDPDAAAALIEQGVKRFPGNLQMAIESARVPQYSQNWDDAVRRWKSVYQRFPHVPAVQAGYARALSRLRRWEEAEAILETAMARHGADLATMRALAECASQRGEWTTAEQRWRDVTVRYPEKPAGWLGLAETLRDSSRLAEAGALLTTLAAKFPGNLQIGRQRAAIATMQRDWAVALPLWVELRRRHPRDAGIAGAARHALAQAQQDQAASAIEGAAPAFAIPEALLAQDQAAAAAAPDAETNLAALFMKFESIGDTCEFGMVQRRFGAEPISLLRWSSTPPAAMIKALNTRFDGVGEAEFTIISVIHGEYTSRDSRYHMFSHSFTPEAAEPLPQFTKQYLRRTQYLRRKLVDEITAGEKIFVYKSVQGLPDETIDAIFQAMAGYGGQAPLLCVRLADDAHPCGTLEQRQPGLFIGYIDRFSTVDINADAWVELCRKADAAVQAWRASLEAAASRLRPAAVG
jgi:tetratricopeptide (TPR) repeat protein